MSFFPGPTKTISLADPEFYKYMCPINEHKIPLVQLVMLTIFVVVGLVGNGSVAFVCATLKEYSGSRQGWLLQQMTIANIVHLIVIMLTIASEAIGKWTMGVTACKFKNFSYEASFYVSVIYLIVANIERTITFTGTHLPRGVLLCCSMKGQRVISAIFVWALSLCCCIYQYQYSGVDLCFQCVLEHPISHQEFCDLIKMNSTQCDLLEEVNKNTSAVIYIEEEYSDYGNSSEDVYNYLGNISIPIEEIAFLDLCKHDEMRLFFVELYTKFSLLFMLPILVMIISTCTSTFSKNTTISGQLSTTLHHWMMTVNILNILFVVSWLPWQVTSLAQVKGLGLDNATCLSILRYSKFSKVFYPVLFPFIYIIFTKNFRHQLITALASIAYCMVEHAPYNSEVLGMRQPVGPRISQETQCFDAGDSGIDDHDTAS